MGIFSTMHHNLTCVTLSPCTAPRPCKQSWRVSSLQWSRLHLRGSILIEKISLFWLFSQILFATFHSLSLCLSAVLEDLTLLELSWKEKLGMWAPFNHPATVTSGDRQQRGKSTKRITVLLMFLWKFVEGKCDAQAQHLIWYAQGTTRWAANELAIWRFGKCWLCFVPTRINEKRWVKVYKTRCKNYRSFVPGWRGRAASTSSIPHINVWISLNLIFFFFPKGTAKRHTCFPFQSWNFINILICQVPAI